jgi:hypothetical protein
MDFDISPVWKGQHTFLKPAMFAPGQAFNGAALKFTNQQKGAIAFFDGKDWKSLNIVNSPQALVILNGLPVWGNIDASILSGTISAKNGGTGLSNFEKGAILYANSIDTLTSLSPVDENNILALQNNLPSWIKFPGILGAGKSSYLAVWSSEKDLCATNIQIDQSGLIIHGDNASINLSAAVLSSNNNSVALTLNKDAIVLTKDTFAIQHNDKTIVKFWKGKLTHGVVPVERIEGAIEVSQGGTGILKYSPGDILYALDEKTISTLSIDNTEGYYIKSVNGRPQWAPMSAGGSQTTNTMLALNPGTSHRAPLQFQDGILTNSPSAGAIEWDGLNVYVTNADKRRKALVFQGDNIIACAKGVTEPIPINMGGTGRDLSNLSIGGLLFIDSTTSIGVMEPENGQFVRIHPSSGIPFWSHAVVEIAHDNSLIINKTNKYTPYLSINQGEDFEPHWLGNHVFEKGVTLGEESTLTIPKNNQSSLPQIHFEQCSEPNNKQNGDMWFDNNLFVYVNGATFNLTEASQNKSMAHVQHLRICEEISPQPNSKRKVKYPLPYGADGMTKVKWKLVRADLRIEDCPTTSSANMNIYINEHSILESSLTVDMNSNHGSSNNFTMPYVYSGDLITLEFLETGDGDCWGLYLTISEGV